MLTLGGVLDGMQERLNRYFPRHISKICLNIKSIYSEEKANIWKENKIIPCKFRPFKFSRRSMPEASPDFMTVLTMCAFVF